MVLKKMTSIMDKVSSDLDDLKKEGFYKEEKIIISTIKYCSNYKN